MNKPKDSEETVTRSMLEPTPTYLPLVEALELEGGGREGSVFQRIQAANLWAGALFPGDSSISMHPGKTEPTWPLAPQSLPWAVDKQKHSQVLFTWPISVSFCTGWRA